jgi:FkbM family methyltransferase
MPAALTGSGPAGSGRSPADSPAAAGDAGITVEAALALLFPAGLSARARELAAGAAGKQPIDAAGLRRALGAVDRLTEHSPALIRFGPHDVVARRIRGMLLLLDRADSSVSSIILRDRAYEPHLTPVFEHFCRPGATIVDIGANIGYYSLLGARLGGPQGRVIAFEPNSENCRLLLLAAAMNGISTIDLLPVSLDDRRGWSYFSTALGTNGRLVRGGPALADGSGFVVPTFTLDEVVDGPVDVIKADAEGAEYRIFSGAARTLSRCRPVVLSEFSPEMLTEVSGCCPADYLRRFAGLGYRSYLIGKNYITSEITDPDDFVASWGAAERIEDLLMVPA